MKKLLGILFAIVLTLSPLTKVLAANVESVDLKKYETLNFKEVLESEGIELKGNYQENDKQVPIYVFRGQGCHYCKAFLTFLSSINEEYGKYFKVVSFESWGNNENAKLMEKLSTFIDGSAARGVPYIIIGKQAFPGYASDYDDAIKETIKAEYNAKEKYDVIEAYNEYLKDTNKSNGTTSATVILWNAFFIMVATIIILCYISSQNRKMLRAMGLIKPDFGYNDVEKEK